MVWEYFVEYNHWFPQHYSPGILKEVICFFSVFAFAREAANILVIHLAWGQWTVGGVRCIRPVLPWHAAPSSRWCKSCQHAACKLARGKQCCTVNVSNWPCWAHARWDAHAAGGSTFTTSAVRWQCGNDHTVFNDTKSTQLAVLLAEYNAADRKFGEYHPVCFVLLVPVEQHPSTLSARMRGNWLP